jgi:hypothetical protein
MPGPEYYRRQADICLIAEALIAKATELLERAKEAERGTEGPLPTSHLTGGEGVDGAAIRR